MLKLAEQFGISNVAIAKRCRRLAIPRPTRGYWVKLEFGKKPGQPPLPPSPEETAAQEAQNLSFGGVRLTETDMALIVAPGQNEIEQMRALGLDIAPHRRRMNDEALDEKFKDSADPLRLVFVCAMWLTGFDAPSGSTVYLDKPMRNHTLMQTIARANRVYPGKHSGLIVDYANVFASLEKALAIYGAGTGGRTPVRNKAELVAELKKALEAAVAFCTTQSVNLEAIQAAGGMDKLTLLGDAVDRLISPDPLRKDFLAHEKLVTTLYRAVKPDPAVLSFVGCCATIAAVADATRSIYQKKRGLVFEHVYETQSA